MLRIAINGFGRIGRNVLRALYQSGFREQIQVVAINDLADVFSDPQLLSREMFLEMSHPTLGKIKQTGLPLKFSRTPGGLDRPPPLLGEHNQEVLQDLGFSSAEIEELKSQEVI